jgi:hypothetical protein
VTDASEDRRPRIPLEEAREAFVTSSFTRLARVHVMSIAGDALFTMGLAGTVFFDTDNLDNARINVMLTLLLTIAPFAVAAPLIGPTLDRLQGGRRWMILGTCAGRAVLSILLVQNFTNWGFYPLAFGMLVLGKSYQISKSALVPTTVHNDRELVEANSKLTLLSGLAVVAATVPGAIFWKLGGPDWVVGLSFVVFAAGAALSVRLPSVAVAAAPPDDVEKQELRSAAILLAAWAMAILRGQVGFVSFLLAFAYKGDNAWKLGVLAAAAQAGFLLGAGLAPRLRKLVEEEYIIIGVLLSIAVVSLGAAFSATLFVSCIMSCLVGTGSSAGKQAFDSLVQRDAPDANRGRSFARFETRFQLAWVGGALVPVVIHLPVYVGYVMMSAVGAFGGLSYWAGLRSANMRASALIRRIRRQQRADDDLELVRDLGFDSGLHERPDRHRRRGSAAARAAEWRRQRAAARTGRGETPPVEPLEPGAPVFPAAPPETPEDEGPVDGPDLDWHPRYP